MISGLVWDFFSDFTTYSRYFEVDNSQNTVTFPWLPLTAKYNLYINIIINTNIIYKNKYNPNFSNPKEICWLFKKEKNKTKNGRFYKTAVFFPKCAQGQACQISFWTHPIYMLNMLKTAGCIHVDTPVHFLIHLNADYWCLQNLTIWKKKKKKPTKSYIVWKPYDLRYFMVCHIQAALYEKASDCVASAYVSVCEARVKVCVRGVCTAH